jgi:hypothetical protein
VDKRGGDALGVGRNDRGQHHHPGRDLEYYPTDYVPMIDTLLANPRVAAVCGSRYLKYPSRRGGDTREVGIRYFPRSREEGKKIGARDWFRVLRTFSRHRNG